MYIYIYICIYIHSTISNFENYTIDFTLSDCDYHAKYCCNIPHCSEQSL